MNIPTADVGLTVSNNSACCRDNRRSLGKVLLSVTSWRRYSTALWHRQKLFVVTVNWQTPEQELL